MGELRAGGAQEVGRLQEMEALLRECEGRLALVNVLAKRIKGGETTEAIVRATVEGVAKYFPEFDTSFATADPQGVTAVCTAFRDGTVDTTQRRTEAALPSGYLESLLDRTVVAVPDLSAHEPAGPLDDALAAGNVRAYLNVAFSYGNSQVGFLAIHCEEPHAWTEHEKATVQQAADVLAVALDAAADKHQLHESEEKFRLLTEHSDINISLVQSQGIVYANPTMQRMTGYSEAELREMNVLDLVDREQWELAQDWVSRRFSGEPMHAPLELKIIPKDGPARWIEFSGCTIELDGEPTLLSSGIETTDRRQAEQILLDSESRLRAVLDQLGDGVCVVADGQLVYMNPALCHLVGYTHREIQGMDPLDFMVESERDVVRSEIRRYATSAARPTDPREFEVRHKDGTTVSVEGIIRKIEYGGTDALLISVRDITERKRAERAVRETESKYRSLVENSLVGVYIVQEMTFVYCNPRMADIFGYTQGELLALPSMLELISGRDTAAIEKRLRDRLEGSSPSAHYTFVARRKDGQLRHIEVHGKRTDLDGRPAIIGACLDITERVERDEALKASEQRFRALFEQAPIGMVIALPDSTVIKVNAAFCAMLGYTEAELTGKSFVEVTHEDDLGGTPESAKRVLDSRAPAMRIHKRYLRKDGMTVHAETTVSPVLDASGNLLRSVAMIEDVTERRELERQLQQVQQLESVGQLAGGVAHNFNNALTAIYGYAELLSLRLEPDDPAIQDLEQIKRVAEQSANLTRQLLAFSRKEQLQLSAFCLNDVVRGACGILAPIMGTHVQIDVHLLEDGESRVLGDRGQMEQVLTNLILNARDAMPSGGTVTVETGQATVDKASVRTHPDARPRTYVTMTVTDTGLGMEEETVSRIFEPFFTTKEPDKGVGLGLAMVHGAVKQSGGFVTVDSTIGEGTSFTVYLPEHSQRETQLPGTSTATPAIP